MINEIRWLSFYITQKKYTPYEQPKEHVLECLPVISYVHVFI